MKNLLLLLLLIVSGAASAQTAPAAPTANRKTVLLATPAPATPAAVGTHAVPPLVVPRSEYIMTNGRITGGKTTFKSKKK